MKIADSSVFLNAQWSQTRQHSAKETIQFWNQDLNQSTEENVLMTLSEEGKALQQNTVKLESTPGQGASPFGLTDQDEEKLTLLEDFIYILTGKRLKFKILDKIKLDGKKLEELKGLRLTQPARVLAPAKREGWGFKLDYNEFTRETQKMAFTSAGSVTTSDGREIKFNMNFSVSREFVESKSLSIRAGDALLDPLVINFKNASAALGERNYSFDIDCDGTNDTLSFTAAGSGFLALDTNRNNTIDNGSELFGPQTGNGFSELSHYDGDGNGWIDENDAIYSKLKIWTLDAQGNKTLLALGQAGVGAIYLGNVQSEFGLKAQNNETLGQIRQTGIFLKESGEVGTIQHVDLAI